MKEYRGKLLSAAVIFTLLIFSYLYKNKDAEPVLLNSEDTQMPLMVQETESDEKNQKMYIHISGQVKFPGLIEIQEGTRLYDAVEKAGGLTEEADLDRINLAIKLNDEQKIYIPKVGEEATENQIYLLDNLDSKLININTADKQQLMDLPGIGEKTADKIIEYRLENKFKDIEDLKKVPGIGNKKFEEIKQLITI